MFLIIRFLLRFFRFDHQLVPLKSVEGELMVKKLGFRLI